VNSVKDLCKVLKIVLKKIVKIKFREICKFKVCKVKELRIVSNENYEKNFKVKVLIIVLKFAKLKNCEL
jgi:hypothetical protein